MLSRHSTSAKLGYAALALALVTPCVVGVLTYRELVAYRAVFSSSEETRRILALNGSLLGHMLDAETGERGYLLTGSEEYLQPYKDARQLVTADLLALHTITPGDRALIPLLQRLEAVVNEKFLDWRTTISS